MQNNNNRSGNSSSGDRSRPSNDIQALNMNVYVSNILRKLSIA